MHRHSVSEKITSDLVFLSFLKFVYIYTVSNSIAIRVGQLASPG